MSSERRPAYACERHIEDIFLRPLSPTSYSVRRAESVSWTVLKIARETRPTRDNIQIAIWGILLLANERRIEAEILMNGLSLRDPQVIGTLAAASPRARCVLADGCPVVRVQRSFGLARHIGQRTDNMWRWVSVPGSIPVLFNNANMKDGQSCS